MSEMYFEDHPTDPDKVIIRKPHMKHEKTFDAIAKLKEIEIELHRLKNALEIANKALDAKREWVGITDEEFEKMLTDAKFTRSDLLMIGACVIDICNMVEAKLKEKNS